MSPAPKRKGAFDYISKPPDLNRWLITIRNALDKSSLVQETKVLKKKGTGRELGANMGIRSMTLSASGVFTDTTGENNLRGAAFTGSAVNYDLVFGDGSDVKGAFIVTSYERAGEFNGEETYSVTLESS